MTATDIVSGFRARIDLVRQIDTASVLAPDIQHRHTVKDVRKGGVIRLHEDTYLVTGVSTYRETDESFSNEKKDSVWYELRCINLETGIVVWIEWEEDDHLVISLTTGTLRFRDLQDEDGVGIGDDDLDQIVEDEDDIYYRGCKYEYDDDYAARYYRDGPGRDTKGDKVYFYDFSFGDETLTIEEWKDGKNDYSYELFLSCTVEPRAVTIIALGTEG